MDIVTLSPSPVELHLDDFEVEARSITTRIVTGRAGEPPRVSRRARYVSAGTKV